MLNIEHLTFRYPGRNKAAIDDLSLKIHGGAIYGLLGRNGVGKSTLLNLIAGLLTPDSGRVELNGTDTRRRLPSTLSSIFVVPEELTLPDLTLKDFVSINAPFYPGFSHDDLQRHLTTFEIDPALPYKLTSLSMGQRKKVFMSFALACNTPLVLMDEPTNGLDIPGKMAFRRFISGASENRCIIISTHQVRDIETLLDQVLIISDEKVLLNASTADIASRLAFLHTPDPAVAAEALFSQPTIGGMAAVVRNNGDLDTEINLELLFELATNRPELMAQIFSGNE